MRLSEYLKLVHHQIIDRSEELVDRLLGEFDTQSILVQLDSGSLHSNSVR